MTTIHAAAALIATYDAPMAAMFVSRPFHRRAIVQAFFLSLRNTSADAYRVRVVLHRALDALEAQRAAAEANQL